MKSSILTLTALMLAAGGCGAPQETAAPATPGPVEAPAETAAIPMRNMATVTIGPYEVHPMYEEELEDGHYNLHVTGGEVAAVRIWVGSEDASDAMVVKTEIENDYHHGHVEVPNPVPAGSLLWIEIEAPDGSLVKGSTPLAAAN